MLKDELNSAGIGTHCGCRCLAYYYVSARTLNRNKRGPMATYLNADIVKQSMVLWG